jgi:hypothetical protein
METEIEFHHVLKTVTYERWQNWTNKIQVSEFVEQHGQALGLIRRMVGNDTIPNIIRKGRNLESVT